MKSLLLAFLLTVFVVQTSQASERWWSKKDCRHEMTKTVTYLYSSLERIANTVGEEGHLELQQDVFELERNIMYDAAVCEDRDFVSVMLGTLLYDFLDLKADVLLLKSKSYRAVDSAIAKIRATIHRASES